MTLLFEHPLFAKRADKITRERAVQLANKLLTDGILEPLEQGALHRSSTDISSGSRKFKDGKALYVVCIKQQSLERAQTAAAASAAPVPERCSTPQF